MHPITTPGAIIREARTDRGLTQADLATRQHVTRTVIAHLESDRRDPRWSTVIETLHALGATVELHVRLPHATQRFHLLAGGGILTAYRHCPVRVLDALRQALALPKGPDAALRTLFAVWPEETITGAPTLSTTFDLFDIPPGEPTASEEAVWFSIWLRESAYWLAHPEEHLLHPGNTRVLSPVLPGAGYRSALHTPDPKKPTSWALRATQDLIDLYTSPDSRTACAALLAATEDDARDAFFTKAGFPLPEEAQ